MGNRLGEYLHFLPLLLVCILNIFQLSGYTGSGLNNNEGKKREGFKASCLCGACCTHATQGKRKAAKRQQQFIYYV